MTYPGYNCLEYFEYMFIWFDPENSPQTWRTVYFEKKRVGYPNDPDGWNVDPIDPRRVDKLKYIISHLNFSVVGFCNYLSMPNKDFEALKLKIEKCSKLIAFI